MKLMLASLDTGDYENVGDVSHLCKYLLSSFHYLKKHKSKDLYNLVERRNAEGNFILDSGAFTMFTKKNNDLDGYIEEYINFINKYDIKHYIELDIDVIVGYEEVKRIRKYIEGKTGKPSIPVWHKSRGIDEWRKLVDEYDYVAIGGLANKSIKPDEYKNMIPMIKYAKSKGCKVHGLGFTGQKCGDYGFYSVDSSSWSSGRRFGSAVKFVDGSLKSIKKPDGVRADYETIDRNNFIEWCKYQRYMEQKSFNIECMQLTTLIKKLLRRRLYDRFYILCKN